MRIIARRMNAAPERVALEVAHEPSVSTDPGQGTFDDPALGEDDEGVRLVAFDDSSFHLPAAVTAAAVFGP